MPPRHTRVHEEDWHPRRRWGRRLLFPAALAAAVWFAPVAAVLAPVRDWPLRAALAGIDGRIGSRSASWNWFGTVEFRDVLLVDRTGTAVAGARRLVVERGLAGLLLARGAPGTVRVIGAEALVEVRPGGSRLEDVLAPWLAGAAHRPAAPPFEIEFIDASVEVVDTVRNDAWRISELIAVGSVFPPETGSAATGPTFHGWTVAGRIVHGGTPRRDLAAAFTAGSPGAPAGMPARLPRGAVVAAATATLARSGGWSVSSPGEAEADGSRTIALAANGLPLDVSRVVATRFALPRVLDGAADVRLDIRLPGRTDGVVTVKGMASAVRPTVCHAGTLAPLVALERVEAPLDLTVDRSTVTLRDCRLASPLFRAEASGRIGLPQGSAWDWAETLIGDDFALTADIDLSAASRGVTGGLQVRPDVRVTGGEMRLAAVARPEGTDRVLEVRVGSRDLEVLQGTRTLRWGEPFVAWLRGRRGAGRLERMRVEEARLTTSAIEVTASGTSESSEVRWTADLGRLLADAGEVLDLGDIDVAGSTRGQALVERAPATGAVTAVLTGAMSGFRWRGAGLPAWEDEEVAIEARAAGTITTGALVVDDARFDGAAGGDRLEVTLGGGAVVDPWALAVGGRVRAGAGVTAGVALEGDMAKWQARFARLPGAAPLAAARIGGRLRASAALEGAGERWQVTRAAAEAETFSLDDGRFVEPRVVATAAGVIDTASGSIEVSSAEVLSASLSVRTGGLVLLPSGAAPAAHALGRLRGRVQWQLDVGRLEPWFVGTTATARWPASGRVWGTAEIQDTPAGVNLLLDATGSQLSLSSGGEAAGDIRSRPVWEEPRARFSCEVTRGAVGDTLAIHRMALESSTVALAAAGTIQDLPTTPRVELGGTVSYDWSLLSRLGSPWTGGRIDFAGGAARPFLLRTPVRPLAQLVSRVLAGGAGEEVAPRAPADASPATTVEIPLPESWLATARGAGRDASPERPSRATVPVSLKPPVAEPWAEWLRSVSIDTSTNWAAGAIEGVAVDGGETPVRLFEGQLALGPFDIGFGGGRLRGAPWVQLLPAPGEIVVPPGRVAERILLAGPLADRWMTWMFPLLGRSTRTRGLVSVDVAGARLPVGDPWSGEAAGAMVFESLEVTPGPLLAPLANLVVRLQSVIDPRFAFGDKAVLLRVRPDPVRFRVTGGRTWHDGLLMDMGQLVLRSAGSVGHDGSLAMTIEIGFRGDLVAGAPRLARLLRTPLSIPLRGTVEQPHFDVQAMERLLVGMADNTAESVIREGFEETLEGLEELFGNPPPRAPALPPPSVGVPAVPVVPPPGPAAPVLSFPESPGG